MFAYLISYDLHAPAKNREIVEEEIKLFGSWCKYLTNTFLVKTSNNIDVVNNRIIQHLDSNDRLMIIEVKKPIGGRLDSDQWDWIHKNL